MWDTLGLWLGPTLAVAVGAAGTKWLGWFQPRLRRRVARERIAEGLAYLMTHDSLSGGQPHLYERYLEHFHGGRDAAEEMDKANVYETGRGVYDARGPAPKWWQRLLRELS
jgi:hypothetical protein